MYLINTFGKGETHLGRVRINLTSEEKAQSVLIDRLCSGNLWNFVFYYRYMDASYWPITSQFYGHDGWLGFLRSLSFRRRNFKWMRGSGYARNSKKDLVRMARDEIEALSVLLGSKTYFNGNEPTPVDAAVFGVLDVLLNEVTPLYAVKDFASQKSNLVAFVSRMRSEFFLAKDGYDD